jgi:DNA-binding winged helix-turn-helix (wHTH) protein
MDFLKDVDSNELILELQRRGYAISPNFFWCDDDVDASNEYLQVDLEGVDKTEIVLDALGDESVIQLVNQRIYDALSDIQANG